MTMGNSKCSYRKMIVELEMEKPDSAPTFTAGTAVVTIDSDENEEKLQRILDKTLNACPVGKLFEAAIIDIATTLKKATLLPT